MLTDFSTAFSLWPLPCGCAFERTQMGVAHVHLDLGASPSGVVECPWCDATFDADELHRWMHGGGAWAILLGSGPRPLVDFDGVVLEVVGHCGCGAPMARESRRSTPVHLSVSAEQVRLLSN